MKLQLDNTRIQTQIKQLKQSLEHCKAEITTKEKEIKEKEMNIKKSIDIIDKNQRIINELRCKTETTNSKVVGIFFSYTFIENFIITFS